MANNQNLCAEFRLGQHKRVQLKDKRACYSMTREEIKRGEKVIEAGISKDLKVGDVVKA